MTALPKIAPPALATTPQFTAEYWSRVPRDMKKCKLVRMTKLEDGKFIEFVFDNDSAFQRRVEDLDPEIHKQVHVNLEVFVQSIKGEMVTGLFIPTVGWLFKMTDEALADYAKKLTTVINNQRNKAKTEMTEFIATALEAGIAEQCEIEHLDGAIDAIGPIDLTQLAKFVITALENAKP